MPALKAQKANGPAYMPGDGRMGVLPDKIVLGAAAGGGVGTPAPGDTIDFLVPAGTLLTRLKFVNDDCDTGTTFAGSIGYRPVSANDGPLVAAASYFRAGGALFQAAGAIECDFKPIKFNQDVFITISVTAAPTGITGNPEIHCIPEGAMEGPK